MTKTRRFGALLVAVLALFAVVPAFADDDNDDPPGRVARLKYASGEVSVQPGGVNEWVGASVNRPLTTSDRVWADKNSRAELHLGTAAIRLADETSVTLSNVSDNTVQVELHQGTLNLYVRKLYSGEIYEIDTPNLAFTVTKSGEYRFDVDSTGDTTVVTVWKGRGEATGDGRAVRVEGGERVRFTSGTSLAHDNFVSPRPDGFDDWCRVRDKRESGVYSARYVSPSVIGYEDLDGYGRWDYYPDYGRVWFPTVASGWSPYSYGRWVWIRPWGWTWVDDSPWGFAPFHYGRWVHYRSRWGWVPGPYYVRPVYAPALVAWVGGSWGVGFSFGGPSVGWFPLGYREPYFPYYRSSQHYWRNVNVTNTRITNVTVINNYYNNRTHINNVRYANRNVQGAVIAARHDALVNSERIDRVGRRLDKAQLRDASLTSNIDVRPTRNTVLGGNENVRRNAPSDRITDRRVVTKIAPPARQQQTFERGGPERPNVGRTADVQQRGNNVAGRPEREVPRPQSSRDGERGSPVSSRVVERPVTRQTNDNSPRVSDRVPRPGSQGVTERQPEMRGNDSVPRPGNERVTRERATVDVPRPTSTPMRNDLAPERGNSGNDQAVPRPTERPVQERNAPRDSIVRPDVDRGGKYDAPRREVGAPRAPRSESYVPESRSRSVDTAPRSSSVDRAPRSAAPSVDRAPRSSGGADRAPRSSGGGGGGDRAPRGNGGNSGGGTRHVERGGQEH
jgi:hypothetical protein